MPPPIPLDTRKIVSLFLDESSQTKHRYLTLGCLLIENESVSAFGNAIEHSKELELPSGELKWEKVSSAKLHAYKLVVDRFFDFEPTGARIEFHSLAVDTSKIKDHVYNDGDREIGFNKEVYQLLFKCAKIHPSPLFHAYPDNRSTTSTPEKLREILNAGCRKKNDPRIQPFRRLQFRDSKEVICLQMTDLLLGAISYQINGHHLKPEASKAKKHLSEYILGRAGVKDPMSNSSVRGKFTIWHRQLK